MGSPVGLRCTRGRVAQLLSGRVHAARDLVLEHRIIDASGRHRVVMVCLRAHCGADGRPLRLSGSAVDVTNAERAHYVSAEPTVEGLQAQLVDLTKAVESRDLIGQAKGILMERYKISADDAFGLLRQASMSHQLKLTAVADQLVFSGQLPSDDPKAGRGRNRTAT